MPGYQAPMPAMMPGYQAATSHPGNQCIWGYRGFQAATNKLRICKYLEPPRATGGYQAPTWQCWNSKYLGLPGATWGYQATTGKS